MTNKVLLKKSSVIGKIPTTADLDYGEVALNFADGRLYFKNAANDIEFFEKDSQTVSNFEILENDLDCGSVNDTEFSAELDLDLITAAIEGSYDLGVLTISGLIYPTQLVLPTFTVSTLPVNGAPAELVFVSDDVGGASIAFNDGTNWRRVSDRTIIS